MYNLKRIATAAILGATMATTAPLLADDNAREIGDVVTAKKLVGANHKIAVLAFEDPDIKGITCSVSRAVTGGIGASLGLSEDTSDASIACRQTGPIVVKDTKRASQDGIVVFDEDRSFMFKKLKVARMFDEAANTFIYLTHSTKGWEGSPKNSLSTVVAMPWVTEGVAPTTDIEAAEDPEFTDLFPRPGVE